MARPSWLTSVGGNPMPFLRAWWSRHPLRIPDETPDQAAIWTIVWMMIPVAILVAITVYGTSIAEHRAAQLERRLAQTHVAENLFRATARLIVSRYQAVAIRAQDLQSQGRAERAAMGRMQASPGAPADASAAELDLLAQENDAVFRLFATLNLVQVPGPADVDEIIERVVVQGVTDMGLGPQFSGRRTSKPTATTGASGERADPAASALPRAELRAGLKHQIERMHAEVKWRASAVVALMGSLVCFTLAAMRAGRLRLLLAALGAAVGALTTGATLAIVRPGWGETGGQALIALFPLLMLQRGRAALAASATPHPLESEEAGLRSYARRVHAGHAHSPFSRAILYAIAATAVMSALTDYGYSRMSVAESTASRSAFEQEGEFTRGVLDWTASRVRMFETTAQLLEVRTRAAVSWARSELAYLGSAAARARARAEVWDVQRHGLETAHPALVRFLDDPTRGLDGSDPFYRAPVPWVLPLATVGEPVFFRAMALWDAENEQAIRAHRSKTWLLQALTIFAIAFYFFGQALGLGEATRGSRWLFAFGVLLALLGSGWGLKELMTSLIGRAPHVSERCRALSADPAHPGRDLARAAAEYFYRAKRDLHEGAWSEAAQGLDCAIELRPTFTAARDTRLRMLEDENAAVRDLSGLALFYEEAGRKTLELEDAFDKSELVVPFSVRLWRERLRLWPPIYRAVAGARHGREIKDMDRREREARAKSLSRLAAEASDRFDHFDLAIYFLAVQRFEDAEREMNLGFDAGAPASYPEILGPGVLDDLAVLDEYCERARKSADCRRLIRQMKDRSVARQAAGAPPGRKVQGQVAITRVTPLGVEWRFTVDGFDPSRDAVYTRVYRVDADATPYMLALQDLTPRTIVRDPSEPAGRYTARQGFVAGSYCHDAESFRGEVYVSGQSLGEASWMMPGAHAKSGLAGMVTAVFPELNLAICHPADWKPMEPGQLQSLHAFRSNNLSGGDPRLTRVFLTSTGAPAALAFNQYTTASRYDVREIVDDILVRIKGLHLVSAVPPFRFSCAGGPDDRSVLANTWRDRSGGVVYVAVVFPDRQRPGRECQVMESIRPLLDFP